MTDKLNKIKYPRTPHLPFSLGVSRDDRVLSSDSQFQNKKIVITEKLDGENISLYSDGTLHARSLDTGYHESRDWLKRWWNEKVWTLEMPANLRICGEYMYATHSIFYSNLEDYFYVHSMWQDDYCLDFEITQTLTKKFGMTFVPIISRGLYDTGTVVKTAMYIADYNRRKGQPATGGQMVYPFQEIEGFVVRNEDGFYLPDFDKNVAKWVRRNHVVGNKHWTQGKIQVNQLNERE